MDDARPLTYQRLQTRAEARSAFDTAIESARCSIALLDRDGSFFGIDRAACAAALERFLRGGAERTIVFVLRDEGFVTRSCPRIVALVARYGSRFRVLRPERLPAGFERGFALFDDTVALRRAHPEGRTTIWDADEHAVAQGRRLLDEVLALCVPAVNPVATGL